MKKFYVFGCALLSAFSSLSQGDSITFESMSLSPESYYDGSDLSGDFDIYHATFTNTYSPDFGGYWVDGFAVSNTTDNTTAGYMNQYSAFTGTGENSENYGVFYSSGTITFDFPRYLTSLSVTNTTYAALSMRDGDAFGKQFGSSLNANGEDDGTNGEDFFLLKIMPLDEFGNLIDDTVKFYLADYRFTDSGDDYIIDSWEKVDFTGASPYCKQIKFELESSDNGGFGMNTPAYFAIDNIVTEYVWGIEEEELRINSYPNPFVDEIAVVTEELGTITIYDTKGNSIVQKEHTGNSLIDCKAFASGIYILEFSNGKTTTTKQLVKR